MAKPLPDQSVFECQAQVQDVKEDIFYAPSPQIRGNHLRHFQNVSPTLRASKKLAKPLGTHIGSFSPYLQKV
jgi:hypothetical protein